MDSRTTSSAVLSSASGTASRGAAFLLHGLNLAPSRMQPLAALLESQGYRTHTLTLSGHATDSDSASVMSVISAKHWRADFDRVVPLDVFEKNPEVLILGFSLGAVVALDASERRGLNIKKMILMAPPLETRLTGRWMDFVTHILPAGFRIPSLNRKDYRAKSYLTPQAYRGLFELIRSVRRSNFKKSKTIPTLVITDLRDELVDSPAIKKISAQNQWQHYEISKTRMRASGATYHLMVDSDMLGDEEWKRLTARIQKFIEVG